MAYVAEAGLVISGAVAVAYVWDTLVAPRIMTKRRERKTFTYPSNM